MDAQAFSGVTMKKTIFQQLVENVTIPSGFYIDDDGIFLKSEEEEPCQVAMTPLVIYGLIRDENQLNWQTIIKWIDLDGHLRNEVFETSLLMDQGFIKILVNLGFKIKVGREKVFKTYLNEFSPTIRMKKAYKLGWYKNKENKYIFVLPEEVIGDNLSEPIDFRPNISSPNRRKYQKIRII